MTTFSELRSEIANRRGRTGSETWGSQRVEKHSSLFDQFYQFTTRRRILGARYAKKNTATNEDTDTVSQSDIYAYMLILAKYRTAP